MKSIFYFCICSIAFSCAPTMYIPNQQNIPAFEKKGEIIINASQVSFGNDFQLAYSFSNKFGVLLNACYFKNKYTDEHISNAPGKGWGLELGGGYYKKIKKYFIFENYTLFGLGTFENEQGYFNKLLIDPYGYLSSDFLRIANQTSITYSKKYLNISLSNRISYLHYYDISNEPYIFSEIDMNAYLKSSPNFTYIEPALTIRSGFKNVKLQMQLQRSFSLKAIPSTDHYQFIDGTAHIGIFVKI